MSEHTPGPWRLVNAEYRDGSDIAVYAGGTDHQEDGVYVAAVTTCWPCHDDTNGGKDDLAEGHANARLIAAAPELLGQAEAIIAWALRHDRGHEGSELLEILSETSAVVRKAKGGDS